ncbi:hypothetical protein DFH06DRAFT_1246501 [Mycena polygramma]|nr:hypothetical protein DFH06DRAFT_1246501 [Mycena polygramma]
MPTTTQTTLLILILAVLHTTYAISRPNITNAARMRAGLGPLKPRALFNPTGVRGARETTPSGSPPAAPTPTQIEVRDSAGLNHIGYIQTSTIAGMFAVSEANNHLVVSSPGTGSGPFNLGITSPIGYPYLGFAVGSSLNLLQTGSSAYMVATNPTGINSPSSLVPNSRGTFSESQIWSQTNTGQLIPTWFEYPAAGSASSCDPLDILCIPMSVPIPVAVFVDQSNFLLITEPQFANGRTPATLWLV